MITYGITKRNMKKAATVTVEAAAAAVPTAAVLVAVRKQLQEQGSEQKQK